MKLNVFYIQKNKKIINEEILKILFDEIKDIKTKGISNNLIKNEDYNNLLKQNQDNNNTIKDLEDKIKAVIKEKNVIKDEINILKDEN